MKDSVIKNNHISLFYKFKFTFYTEITSLLSLSYIMMYMSADNQLLFTAFTFIGFPTHFLIHDKVYDFVRSKVEKCNCSYSESLNAYYINISTLKLKTKKVLFFTGTFLYTLLLIINRINI